MLITPRTYSASQTPDQGRPLSGSESKQKFYTLAGWHVGPVGSHTPADMPLVHQAGSVRVGDVVRYTFSYNPAADTGHPTPSELYVKIKNTSAIPLRAAYLHGPYTLYASCYPSSFDPNAAISQQDTSGTPQFEPYLKAGGSWRATIPIPRKALSPDEERASSNQEAYETVTWRIEIISQVIFSNTASVNFELLIGRDQKSVENVSSGSFSSSESSRPAQLRDHWSSTPVGAQALATNGVYSKAVKLLVDDTASLWNTPHFPECRAEQETMKEPCPGPNCTSTLPESPGAAIYTSISQQDKPRKKRVHLVVLTHGLHSNLGADMLFLKESIDASVQKAKERQNEMRHKNAQTSHDSASAHRGESGSESFSPDDTEGDDEEVIVRGFPGNAVRTERGIQYLGKRLAKYVLSMTYPDQPHLPRKNSKSRPWAQRSAPSGNPKEQHPDDHPACGTRTHIQDSGDHAHQITSISFIGHSLGGLIQTYAIAYIQKHSPGFFDMIRPVNFIALATPFLGLSNENPMYVKFALDLGLVGRTGQDLGLSWTAPRVRSGWEAIIGGKGDPIKSQNYTDAGSKPLLRILPCGPAHEVLGKFQRRTIYSNVVNDGIVPLRTSCLLYLDWKGLDRVEKARRDNGIVGTMAEWGWAELTGANSKSPKSARPTMEIRTDDAGEGGLPTPDLPVTTMPSQQNATAVNSQALPSDSQISLRLQEQAPAGEHMNSTLREEPTNSSSYSPLSSFLSMFKPKQATKGSGTRQTKIYKRSQTLGPPEGQTEAVPPSSSYAEESLTRDHLYDEYGLHAPPKTTFFESASDLLLPPLPPVEFITDPSSRPRTIFHDRVYQPDDVPSPLPTKRRALTFGPSPTKASDVPPVSPDGNSTYAYNSANENESGLKIEEKIARAYHRNLSWRKVLVRLEPDAHNNIIVRRMFTNAYGWPVVQHLVDTHFGLKSAAHSSDLPRDTTEELKSLSINTGNIVEPSDVCQGIHQQV
ncbi:putative serine esterase-domain-containing protein [Aspergillus ambiguus]|uniref:lipase ROG1 family protein n=1 Tax=Aspergillus ambiguus TaxID=176160 RepID=UPI003CCD3EE8